MSVSAIGIGLSGMQSYSRALDVSANNVANTLSTGFTAQQAKFQETPGGGTAVTGTVASQAGTGTDIASEMVDQLTYKAGFEASAKVVKTSDDMLGSLINTRA